MKRIIILAALLITTSANADFYKWEDKNGVYYTDDISKIPVKYRAQALDDVREDITIQNPDVARSVARDRAEQRKRDQQDAREQAQRTRQAAEERRLVTEYNAELARQREADRQANIAAQNAAKIKALEKRVRDAEDDALHASSAAQNAINEANRAARNADMDTQTNNARQIQQQQQHQIQYHWKK